MAQSVEVISHWHQSVEGLSTSTLAYYESVEKALRDKEVPELRIERISANEHGLLSAKREYLRVSYGRLSFDIGGAPFGKDFFFSWWLVRRTPGFAALLGLRHAHRPAAHAFSASSRRWASSRASSSHSWLSSSELAVAEGRSGDGWSAIEDSILAMPVIGFLYRKFVKPGDVLFRGHAVDV